MTSEKINVSTWNIQGALSDPERVEAITKAIDNQKNTSLFVFPDAWHEDSEESTPTNRGFLLNDADFQALGYTPHRATFREDRSDDNFARYGFLTLTHESLPVLDATEIKLGTRPAHHLRVGLAGTAFNVISLYLNDQSEDNRLQQLADLRPVLSALHKEPIVLLGDFNAMHRSSTPARLLRTPGVQKLSRHITAKNNTLPRLVDMAQGHTMTQLTSNGFFDADPEHQATMPSSFPLFQLDHIMFRHSLNKRLSVEKPVRTLHAGVSDHVQLSAVVAMADSHEHSHH